MRLLSDRNEMAAWIQMADQAVKAAPSDRQSRVDLAKGLSVIGERARAAAVLPPVERTGRLSLTDDGPGLAAEASRLGTSLWDREPSYWDFASQLVEHGHGRLLLQLYDARFHGPEEFVRLEGAIASDVAPAVIAAMQEAGRRQDAGALTALMLRRLDSDVREGVPAGNVAYSRAALLALTGAKTAALDQLELAAATSWTAASPMPYRRLGATLAFRALADEPRLQALDAAIEQQVNRQRALLKLPPLTRK
jgi:hypothetical protein